MAPGANPAVLAVEVGVSSIRGVVVDSDNVTQHEERIASPVGVGDAKAVEAVRTLARQTVRNAGRVTLVGGSVVVPGIVDSERGIVRYSAEFGWHNVPLAQLVSADVAVPITVEQNVRAAALAEGATGAARGISDWLYVSIGAMISGAAVVGGFLQRGATGAAGEFGHLPIYPFGDLCACGQRGCVEAYASATAISARYERVSGTTLDLAAIARRVGRDPLADEVWTHAVLALGLGLTSYTMIEDPGLIVIGGEFVPVADIALPTLRAELRTRLLWRQAPRMVAALLGADAALLGAVQLGWIAAEVV